MENEQKPLKDNSNPDVGKSAYDFFNEQFMQLLENNPEELFNSTSTVAENQPVNTDTQDTVEPISETSPVNELEISVESSQLEEEPTIVAMNVDDDTIEPEIKTATTVEVETSTEASPDNTTSINRHRTLLKNAVRVAAVVTGLALAINLFNKKENPLFAQNGIDKNTPEQVDGDLTDFAKTNAADISKLATIKPEVKASAKAAPTAKPVTFSLPASAICPPAYEPVMKDIRKDESGNNYTESPHASSCAIGAYQTMPETLRGWGYLVSVENNPDFYQKWTATVDTTHMSDHRKQKLYEKYIEKHIAEQDNKSPYMTIMDGRTIRNYKWANKDGMDSEYTYTQTEQGRKVQDYIGWEMYQRNKRYLEKNASDLFGKVIVAENVQKYKRVAKGNGRYKIVEDGLLTDTVLITEAGMLKAAHLMGARGIEEVVRNNFKPVHGIKGIGDNINKNIDNAIGYLINGTDVYELQVAKTGMTHDMLLAETPEYQLLRIPEEKRAEMDKIRDLKSLGKDLTTPVLIVDTTKAQLGTALEQNGMKVTLY